MEINAYFSNIHQVVIGHLKGAKSEIVAAIAWFTDDEIFSVLCDKARSGVSVSIAIISDEINFGRGCLRFQDLVSEGGFLIEVQPASRNDPVMHHKFCVIDRNVVISGSYNWSRKARSNDENITVVTDAGELANKYLLEFCDLAIRARRRDVIEKLRATSHSTVDIDRRRLIGLLKRGDFKSAVDYISNWGLLNEDLIAKYECCLSWFNLSMNPHIPWSDDLLEHYEGKWDWGLLSCSEAITGSLYRIERYKNELDWQMLSVCWPTSVSCEILAKFADYWDWDLVPLGNLLWSDIERILCSNLASAESISYRWSLISENSELPWSRDFLERHKDQWDWDNLSRNLAIPWNTELIDCYESRWSWYLLSANKTLPWSVDLIDRYKDRWDWARLAANPALPWSMDLIERYKNNWVFGDEGYNDIFPRPFSLSSNTGLPWTFELIERYRDKLQWQSLSSNKALPWCQELIARYEDRWWWDCLSSNEGIPFSAQLIEQYSDRWDWRQLSCNRSVPFSEQLIERYKGKWDWPTLSFNESIKWTLDLLEQHEGSWAFNRIREQSQSRFPALEPSDIVEIIEHHLAAQVALSRK